MPALLKLCIGLLAVIAITELVQVRAQDPERRRIPTSEALRDARFKVPPEYPATARQLRLVGKVDVDVEITPGGSVEKITVVNGNMLLANSVISAVKRWKFAGIPSASVTRLSFSFMP